MNAPQLPACNNCTLSLAKVEKVVKPPQNPVVNNRHHGPDNAPHLPKSAYSTPSRKQPARLTANVAHGNPPTHKPFINVDI